MKNLKRIRLVYLIFLLGLLGACQQNTSEQSEKETTSKQITSEQTTTTEKVADTRTWQDKISFDNYLLPEVDSIEGLIKNEYLAFELFNSLKNNDSITFFKQFISFEEIKEVYVGSEYTPEYLNNVNSRIQAFKNPCFGNIKLYAEQNGAVNWQKATIEKVVYDLFDVENNHLFVKITIQIKNGDQVHELLVPDCVYTKNGLRAVQPIAWDGLSCNIIKRMKKS